MYTGIIELTARWHWSADTTFLLALGIDDSGIYDEGWLLQCKNNTEPEEGVHIFINF